MKVLDINQFRYHVFSSMIDDWNLLHEIDKTKKNNYSIAFQFINYDKIVSILIKSLAVKLHKLAIVDNEPSLKNSDFKFNLTTKLSTNKILSSISDVYNIGLYFLDIEQIDSEYEFDKHTTRCFVVDHNEISNAVNPNIIAVTAYTNQDILSTRTVGFKNYEVNSFQEITERIKKYATTTHGINLTNTSTP